MDDPELTWRERNVRTRLAALLTTYADLVGSSATWTEATPRSLDDAAVLEEELMRLRALIDIALAETGAFLDRAADLNLPGALTSEERVQWITDKVLGELTRRG